MDVRTFEAFSMKDAVKSVKKTLGVDAVILSTKEKAAPNGKGTIYEVTAAAASAHHKAGASALTEAPVLDISSQVEAISARLTALVDASATRSQVQALEAGMQELKLLLLESLRNKEGSVLKDLPPPLVTLDRQLRVMGVSDLSIADLVKHLRALPPPEAEAEGFYRDHAIRYLMKRIKIAPRWNLMPGTVAFQAIVGPAGVGKSSLVAKLAAFYAVKEKRRVTVVSLDNQRLAASEQMRVFCRIIGVPFVAATSGEDIATVSESDQGCELVLIDTAGMSPKETSAIDALAALKPLPIDFHLCLSITEKEDHLDQAVRAFSKIGLQSLAFTKLDESWSFGEIYNLSKKWQLPLSFFAIGREIPQDIERATRERVIERLFGI